MLYCTVHVCASKLLIGTNVNGGTYCTDFETTRVEHSTVEHPEPLDYDSCAVYCGLHGIHSDLFTDLWSVLSAMSTALTDGSYQRVCVLGMI